MNEINQRSLKGTAVVILAAGMSRRMGKDNKLMLHAGKQSIPMVRSVAEQALASTAEKVYVVLGHESELVRNSLDGLDLQFIDNANFHEGLSASIKAAVTTLDTKHDSLIITLADMPFVSADLYNLLIDQFRLTGSQYIIAPVFDGRRGNPVLWPRSHYAKLNTVSGDKGGRQLLQKLEQELILISVEDPSVCLDIDNHEQLTACNQRI